jgi:Flp pilus assembly protein TadG
MIIAALVVPVMIGFSALAVEGGLWYADHHQMRNIADAGAYAAGWARHDGTSETNAATGATASVTGYNANTDTVVIHMPPIAGAYAADADAIEVVVTRSRAVLLSALLTGGEPVTIRTRAVVKVTDSPGAAFCMLALGTTGVDYFANGVVQTTLDKCGAQFNSNSSGAITETGNANIAANWVYSGGSLSSTGNSGVTSPDFQTGRPPAADPLANLQFPGSGSCNYTNFSVNHTATLSPGRYCNGIKMNGSGTVTLSPGTYVIDRGSLSVDGSLTVNGSGVTIVMTGSSGNYADLSVTGSPVINLTAPKTGAYEGIVIAKDRNAPAGGLDLGGASVFHLRGAVYAPTQNVSYAGGGAIGVVCTMIIAQSFTMSGNPTLGDNCAEYDMPKLFAGAGTPQLVE